MVSCPDNREVAVYGESVTNDIVRSIFFVLPQCIIIYIKRIPELIASYMMGQGHSTKSVPSSNYAPKSSGAVKHSSKSSHHKSKGSKDKLRTKSGIPDGSDARSSSFSTPVLPYEPPRTRPVSYTNERIVPLRQFSLTRQVPSAPSGPSKHALIEKYFSKYKDAGEEAILAEGMEKFCVDLGVDPTEFVVLVLAWKFGASQMCRFTKEEFLNGCQKMRVHDAKSLKERFPELVAETREVENFQELYNFTFSFGLDHTTGQRSLPVEMAMPLWDLVFTQNRPIILDQWFAFLKESDVRGISRDTWNMFLPFVNTILPDFSNYDESEAWPSLFDDFVEYELAKQS